MVRKLSILAILLSVAGCSQQNRQAAAPAPQDPLIVRVVSRDVTITARATGDGPVYSVQSKSGETIVSDQTLEDLQANEPKLARHVGAMQAGTWAGLD
jgi:hypothetical protein